MAVDGIYDTVTNTPMGAQKGVLTLATNGNVLTGKMSGAGGEIELLDGVVDGDNLTWKAKMTQPMPMTLEFKATINGDALAGSVKLGAFGNAKFTGTRTAG